jgi:formate/nitrite transporter FocA (FNT family)
MDRRGTSQRSDRTSDTPAEQPEAGTRLSARQIHENILRPGEHEMERPAASLLWSAVASGLVIGFSFVAAAFATQLAPGEYGHAAASAAYPLGFIFVVMARSELFTENTLVPVIPLLEHRTLDMFLKLLRLWGLLLAGNLVGALLFGWTLANTSMVSASLHPTLLKIAGEATSGGFVQVAYSGIYAGWLMALLAWLLGSTRATGAQIVLIWLCTAPISAFRFRHSIAGAVEAFYRAGAGAAPWTEMLGEFVVPAVLGNTVGGVLLVALLNYGQVAPEQRRQRREIKSAREEV